MNTGKKTWAAFFSLAILPALLFSMATMMEPPTNGAKMALSRYGSTGQEVVQIQQRLKELGYYGGEADGIFGSGTQTAVKNFQKSSGLAVDGIVGKDTLAKLMASGGNAPPPDKDVEQIKEVQSILKDLGFYMGEVDGKYGTQSKRAVQAFQRAKGLSPDGVVGAQTLAALREAKETIANPSTDSELLARIISAESRGEPYDGQVAVGAVIMNRMSHPSFPSSLAGVVYQPGAFTAVVDGQFDKPVAESSRRAAQDALAGVDPSGGAVYYYNPKTATNAWIRTRPIIKRIGNHVFCD